MTRFGEDSDELLRCGEFAGWAGGGNRLGAAGDDGGDDEVASDIESGAAHVEDAVDAEDDCDGWGGDADRHEDADDEWLRGFLELDEQVGAEDRALVEAVQRGIGSGALDSGVLLPESEQLIARFQALVLEALGE